MLHLILIFTDTFLSLLRPSSGYVTRIQTAYSNCPNCVSKPLDVTDNISSPPCGHKMSDYVVKNRENNVRPNKIEFILLHIVDNPV